MDLRQLELFIAVAEERHFTRAAQRMHIVQSGLSAAIRSLESELGTPLFLRSTRRVEPTAAGKVLLQHAHRVLSSVKAAREAVNAIRGLERGSLSIGTVHSLDAFIDLSALLGVFHGRHPRVDISLCQGGSTLLVDKIRSGRVDFAFFPLFEPPVGVVTRMFACEEMVVVCKHGSPFADTRDLTLEVLHEQPFVDFQSDWGTRQIVDRAFAEASIRRHVAFEVSDLDTLFDLVGRGLGIALMPEAIARKRATEGGDTRLGIARLRPPEICWELVTAYAGRNVDDAPSNPAALAFAELLSGIHGAG